MSGSGGNDKSTLVVETSLSSQMTLQHDPDVSNPATVLYNVHLPKQEQFLNTADFQTHSSLSLYKTDKT